MIFIGLGGNIPSPAGPPAATIEAALTTLKSLGVTIAARSPLYESEPVPRSDQPWFVNAVARLETLLSPDALLAQMHNVERRFGRVRGERNAARTLDLDLLDCDGVIRNGADLTLPHPRLHERAFVLKPLCDLEPGWRHPILGRSALELLAALPESARAVVRPLTAV